MSRLARSWRRSSRFDHASSSLRPNKRLKVAGGDRSKGTGVLGAGAHELSFNYKTRGGRVARSLSATR